MRDVGMKVKLYRSLHLNYEYASDCKNSLPTGRPCNLEGIKRAQNGFIS